VPTFSDFLGGFLEVFTEHPLVNRAKKRTDCADANGGIGFPVMPQIAMRVANRPEMDEESMKRRYNPQSLPAPLSRKSYPQSNHSGVARRSADC
jgi:hypothetical protein